MKKISYLVPIIAILILSSCVTVGPSVKLVGMWQDTGNPNFYLEFTDNHYFNEHLYGKVIGYGEVYPVDKDTIRLHYLSSCGGTNEPSCDVRLRYTVTDETLIITDSQGDMVFTKVK